MSAADATKAATQGDGTPESPSLDASQLISSPGSSDAGPAITSPGSSGTFLGDLGTGLASTLGGGSLATNLGAAAPYLAVGAVGEAQAKAGQAQDKQYADQQRQLAQPALAESANLQGAYDTGTLNAADKAVVDTGIAQGQDTIASAAGLSAIAQQSFANYNSGTLRPGDQAQLDQQVAAAKSQVRQQLASAGITDSTILAGQDQQIDQQALITKNNILNGYFNTGNSAYNSWLTATQEGKAAITQAQTFASTQLQQYLSNSMQEAGIGMGEMNIAIGTQMQVDQEYAAQVSTLLGTLATAYAKQIAGRASSGGGSKMPGISMPGAGALVPKAAGGTGSGDPFAGTKLANTSSAINQYNQDNAPTADDISALTADAGNIDVGSLDAITNVQMPDMSSFSDPSIDLGDLTT